MDRLDLLATIPLRQLDVVYQVRAKVFQAAMRLTNDADLSAQIAAQFSDLARDLQDWTAEPRALFWFDRQGRDTVFRIDFCFDEWIAEPEHFLVGGLYLSAVREDGRYTLTRSYRVRAGLDAVAEHDTIVHILTDKSREELFADLNAKNSELQKEIEERKAAEENVLQTQRELVAKEKLAALGGAGRGHCARDQHAGGHWRDRRVAPERIDPRIYVPV